MLYFPDQHTQKKKGLFVNLEGRMQQSFKATYPPGEAVEDWTVFNKLTNMMVKSIEFKNLNNLRESVNKIIDQKIKTKNFKKSKVNFIKEEIIVKPIDYYYTNAIARSSKVMNECKQISKNFLFTGIEKAS